MSPSKRTAHGPTRLELAPDELVAQQRSRMLARAESFEARAKCYHDIALRFRVAAMAFDVDLMPNPAEYLPAASLPLMCSDAIMDDPTPKQEPKP